MWHWRGLSADGSVIELRDLPLLDLPHGKRGSGVAKLRAERLAWQPERIAQALQATRVTGRLDRRSFKWQGKTLNLLLDVGAIRMPRSIWFGA